MKKQFIYGMMAAAGLLFTGCSSDDILPEENKTLESDQTYYVSMRIVGDTPSSRAASANGNPVDETDFEAGTAAESDVNSVYFVFYDNQGNVIGDVVSADLNDFTKNTSNGTGNTVETTYKSVIGVSVKKGEKQPSQVICYINPISAGNLNVSLSEIQALTIENVSTENGFAMSNSVFYTNDEATAPQIAVALTHDVNLFDTQEDALKAMNNNSCANIYVERYATKLSFDATKAEVTNYKTSQRTWKEDGTEGDPTTITLLFEPQYWAVNAEAKETYAIKSFRKESADGTLLGDNYTFAALNGVINKDLTTGTWSWNNPDYNRSYWGMSPAYFTSVYPEVSSDLAKDHSELQKYISYNELLNGTKGFSAATTTPQYFRETTVGSIALESQNPAAAVASVIYVGKYKVAVGNKTPMEDISFYTYLSTPVPGEDNAQAPSVYFENEENQLTSKIEGTESMLKRFLIQCNILFKKETVTEDGKQVDKFVPYNLENGFGDLAAVLNLSILNDDELTAYDGTAETKLKLQHNARTLRFDEDYDFNNNIYILTNQGYKQIVATVTNTKTQLSLTQANIALCRNVGFAFYYTAGHAYFNIPVKHYGWYREGNTQKGETKIDWSKVRVGDFGMVRNHSYSINVTEIKGLASGIGGDDVEIVPPAGSQDYFMAYTVNILKWAVVPQQDVKL